MYCKPNCEVCKRNRLLKLVYQIESLKYNYVITIEPIKKNKISTYLKLKLKKLIGI